MTNSNLEVEYCSVQVFLTFKNITILISKPSLKKIATFSSIITYSSDCPKFAQKNSIHLEEYQIQNGKTMFQNRNY